MSDEKTEGSAEEFKRPIVPAFCPQCEWVMVGRESIRTYYDFGVCSNCFIEFIEDREERWRSGWRPTPEQVTRFEEKITRGRG
jgi:hypothetical protein